MHKILNCTYQIDRYSILCLVVIKPFLSITNSSTAGRLLLYHNMLYIIL